ncbi:hypothetical protein [Streptomyces sp. NPDC101145]|uniref:hypothetical protein n=1 Tax=Streptomyces sp. NPDC101145 TaxID=3366112 RepID=UPI003812F505
MPRRRSLIGALLALPAAGCAAAAGPGPGAPRDRASATPPPPVRRYDPGPVEARFPQLGPLVDVTWAVWTPPGAHGRQLVPGPTDVRLSGVARLAPAHARRLLAEYAWTPAATPPAPLDAVAATVPPGARWRTSAGFVQAVTRGRYRADFHFDPAGRLMVFDAVDPTRATPASGKGS